jgi:hypothetical protein
MLTDTEAVEAEQTAWEWFAEAHPHEAYASWPESFWEYFHSKAPNVSREQMERTLKATEHNARAHWRGDNDLRNVN